MSATITGYARCSTDRQDLAARRQALLGLGVPGNRIYLDHRAIERARTRTAEGKEAAA
jgi:DNA invertase Pin-like site-specific DNA recombinase